jgi:hypothetical protein
VVGAVSLAGGVATRASIYEAVNGQAWSWNGDGRALSGEERSQAAGQGVVGIATLGFAAGNEPATIRIRHYTNAKGLQGIAKENVILASDQNRVSAESARLDPLSQVQAETKYGLKPGRGRNFVETDVAKSQVSQRFNPMTGANELIIKGDLPLQNPTFIKRP